ncbi:MAG: lysylphosphatidylglycerol synthase transmembrane domain-containing protein, partial [Bacteroidota bacterium]
RCAVLSKYEKLSFSRLVGTVVTERILDLIMLLLALGLLVIVQYNVFSNFVNNDMDLSGVTGFFSSWWFGLILVFTAGAIIVFRQNIQNSRMFFKLKGLWQKFREGLFSYKNIKNKPLFFFHTLLIFVLYFLMIYICFFGFPFTRDLGAGAGLAVFVLGSFGMVAPVQGGIGPWHFMVISTLLFFGVKAPQAAAFALLVHGSLNGMIIVTGLLSLIAIPLFNKGE